RQVGRTDGVLDLDRFGVEDIEQIEILRGPSSALYGSDALAGVVNIVTRRPRDGVALDALTRLDSRLGTDTRARLSLGHRGLAGAAARRPSRDRGRSGRRASNRRPVSPRRHGRHDPRWLRGSTRHGPTTRRAR